VADREPLWISESEVLDLMRLEDAVDVLADAYSPSGQRGAVNMVRTHARKQDAILHAVGGMLASDGVAGTKTWLYTPAGASPVLILFSLDDGSLLGIVEAYAMGQWRTAATAGVGTKFLAREDAEVMALIGTGKQAMAQAQAVAAVRPIREVRVFGRDAARLALFVAKAAQTLGVEVTAHRSLRTAMTGADVVTTITRASEPFVTAELLAEGMHINAVGAIVAGRAELEGPAVGRCDVIVADSPQQAESDSGELQSAAEANLMEFETVLGLADVVADPARGRTSPEQITLFKALGVGLSDVAIGAELLRRAGEKGAGTTLPATPDPDLLTQPPIRSQPHV
jgi:alanine dehydrogenase